MISFIKLDTVRDVTTLPLVTGLTGRQNYQSSICAMLSASHKSPLGQTAIQLYGQAL